jgi:hypothetical protein
MNHWRDEGGATMNDDIIDLSKRRRQRDLGEAAFQREYKLQQEILSLVAGNKDRDAALNVLIRALTIVAGSERVSGLSVVKVLCSCMDQFVDHTDDHITEEFAEFFIKGLPSERLEQDWYDYYDGERHE